MNFSAQKYASHATAVVIDDVIIIGRRRVYCASTLLGRCLCKRVDVYIITLSCTWRIYAHSERLLVHLAAVIGSRSTRSPCVSRLPHIFWLGDAPVCDPDTFMNRHSISSEHSKLASIHSINNSLGLPPNLHRWSKTTVWFSVPESSEKLTNNRLLDPNLIDRYIQETSIDRLLFLLVTNALFRVLHNRPLG